MTIAAPRLALVIVVTFASGLIAPQISRLDTLPSIPSARGLPQACNVTVVPQFWCSEYWVPAGPAMDIFQGRIFDPPQNEVTSFTSASPAIDMMDIAVPPTQESTFTTSPNYRITNPLETSLYSLEFNMNQNFWNCPFSLGNLACGVDVRQGLAHMVDKTKFALDSRVFCVGTNNNLCNAIDNPELLGAGLVSPNPCAWDSLFPETGSNCAVGSPGGTAYHLSAATGANGFGWLQAPGSPDLDAAAAHFVSAGIASGCDGGTGAGSCVSSQDSRLSGIVAQASQSPNVPNLFFPGSNVNPTMYDYAYGLAYQICYIFTGSYSVPCNYLSITYGGITAFPGFLTNPAGPANTNWWMIAEGDSGPSTPGSVDNDVLHAPRIGSVCAQESGGSTCLCTSGQFSDTCCPCYLDPFDDTLYYTYNSRFVDGFASIQSPTGHCAASSVPTNSPADYEFLCNSSFDTLSNQMEFAPCIEVSGDPTAGSGSNTSTGRCSNGSLSSVGAGVEAEDFFGKNAFSIPIVSMSSESGYLNNGWIRVSNSLGTGATNYMTWLNAWNPNPLIAGTISQGMGETRSVNPYIATTSQDFEILGNIYDSLVLETPLDGKVMDWMVLSAQQLPNSALTYTPPAGTQQTFRFTLRSDESFQDGREVTSFDVAFSYLSLVGSGAILSGRADSMKAITILGSTQFDINVNQLDMTPFSIATLPILPGRYWTVDQGGWDNFFSKCIATNAPCFPAQYTLASESPDSVVCNLTCAFPASVLDVNTGVLAASFDPIARGVLIGSGPWVCFNGSSGKPGSGCTFTNTMNPPDGNSYVLSRFGKGRSPGSSVNFIYFRSNGNLATYLWSLDTGDITHDFLNFSVVASCFGAAVTSTGPCVHFQQGIGANGGPVSVGLSQVAIVNRFVGLNWIAPFNWSTSPPLGIVPLNPVLYENTITLSPASVAGCATPYPGGGYDC